MKLNNMFKILSIMSIATIMTGCAVHAHPIGGASYSSSIVTNSHGGVTYSTGVYPSSGIVYTNPTPLYLNYYSTPRPIYRPYYNPPRPHMGKPHPGAHRPNVNRPHHNRTDHGRPGGHNHRPR